MTLAQDIRTVTRAAGGTPQRMTLRQRVAVINDAKAAVQRYARKNPAVNAMLRDRPRLTRFLSTVAGLFGKRNVGRTEIDAAVRMLLAAGFGVTAEPGHRAGRGAKQGLSPSQPAPPPFSPMRPRERDDEIVTAEFADDPVLAEVVGDGKPVDPKEASRKRQAAATVHLVASSNVHSFYWVRERRTGTLYVTFLKWTPKTKTRSGPGPTYAYADVRPAKYLRFKNAAKRSAGKAVWDYLRVRGEGNAHRHQHPYALTRVGALGSRNLDEYVPRKVTRKGYVTRNLPDLTGRSQLQPRQFLVPGNRAKRRDVNGVNRYV